MDIQTLALTPTISKAFPFMFQVDLFEQNVLIFFSFLTLQIVSRGSFCDIYLAENCLKSLKKNMNKIM